MRKPVSAKYRESAAGRAGGLAAAAAGAAGGGSAVAAAGSATGVSASVLPSPTTCGAPSGALESAISTTGNERLASGEAGMQAANSSPTSPQVMMPLTRPPCWIKPAGGRAGRRAADSEIHSTIKKRDRTGYDFCLWLLDKSSELLQRHRGQRLVAHVAAHGLACQHFERGSHVRALEDGKVVVVSQ